MEAELDILRALHAVMQRWWQLENGDHRVQVQVTRSTGLAHVSALDGCEVVLEPQVGRLVFWWSGALGTCTGWEAAQELELVGEEAQACAGSDLIPVAGGGSEFVWGSGC